MVDAGNDKIKTQIDIERVAADLRLLEATRLERETADGLYAIKLVEKIVFGMVALILVAVVSALVALVVR
jgi:hypothetical protein